MLHQALTWSIGFWFMRFCGIHLTRISRLIPGLQPVNERRRYKVTLSLIGWTQTYILPCAVPRQLFSIMIFKVTLLGLMPHLPSANVLTHWGRVTHICVGNLTNIGSDNGLSPYRRQAITWINDGILLIGSLGTHFSGMLIEIHAFSFKKIHLKMSSGKWRPFCLGLNVLINVLVCCQSIYYPSGDQL